MRLAFLNKKYLWQRFFTVVIGVILMGFSLSWLSLVDMGTDPYTAMNIAISDKLGITMGTWQLCFNAFLFIFVIIFGRKYIGLGTLANMVLVGYSIDLFSLLWKNVLPKDFIEKLSEGVNFVRILVLILGITLFVLSCALYVDVNLGTSPYDGMPFVIFDALKKKFPKIPFRIVRWIYDFSYVIVGLIFGAGFHPVTILMAFLLGPAISFVASYGAKAFPKILGNND